MCIRDRICNDRNWFSDVWEVPVSYTHLLVGCWVCICIVLVAIPLTDMNMKCMFTCNEHVRELARELSLAEEDVRNIFASIFQGIADIKLKQLSEKKTYYNRNTNGVYVCSEQETEKSNTGMYSCHRITSVSYTHLDVYKRQVIY